MAEKISESERIETNENENLLEIPEADHALSATDDFDVEAAVAETAGTSDAPLIREQIEESRSPVSETINEIQEKSSAANRAEQLKKQVSEQVSGAVETAKDTFHDKTDALGKSIGRSVAQIANSDLARKAQKNPWIFSVVGMGIGAILVGVLFSGEKPKRKTSHRYKNFEVPQTRQSFDSSAETGFVYQTPENKSNEIVRPVKTGKEDETSNSTFAGVSDAAGSVYRGVNKAAGKTYQTIGKASGYAYEKAGDLGGEAVENYKYYIENNPLAVGAVAVAVGAAIGYAIPLTKTENEYFSEVRDKIFDKAQASAQDAIDSFKQTIGDARQIIAEEVKSRTAGK